MGLLKRLKILVLSNLYPPQELGGYGRSIADFAQLLQYRGHLIKLLTSRADYLGVIDAEEPSIDRRLLLWGSYENGATALSEPGRIPVIIQHNLKLLESLLAQELPDVCLVGNIAFLGMTLLQPLLDRQIPIVHHYGVTGPLFQVAEFPRSKYYHLAVASDYVRDSLLSYGFPVEGSRTIYPGACVRQFLYRGPTLRDEPLRIATASLLTPSKGIHILLEALVQLRQWGIPFTCTLAGAPYHQEYVRSMQQYLQQQGLAEQVHFCGLLDRETLIRFHREQHVLVFPSLETEAFGISQVEAMAAGAVVITSGVGGAAEVIEDGVSGLVSAPGDTSALAVNLQKLALCPEWRRQLAAAGQQRAVELYDVERSVDQLEQLFQELLQQRLDFEGEVAMAVTEAELERAARLIDSQDYTAAAELCKHLLQKEPDCADVHVLLGNLYFRQEEWAFAAHYFHLATEVIQDNPFLYNNCGLALAQAHEYVAAETAFRHAIALDPEYVTAWFNLGFKVYKGRDQEQSALALGKAIALYRQIIADGATVSATVYRNLGDSCAELHNWREALEAYQQALACGADDRQALLRNSATCHVSLLEYGPALEILDQLRVLGEDAYPDFWSRFGTIAAFVGRVAEGVAAFAQAFRLAETEEDRRNFSGCSMFMQHYLPQFSPESIAAAHRAWGERYCPMPVGISFQNKPFPDRRLRIGYVSPDFRNHAVVFFVQPVLAAHDTSRFEVFCYSNVEKPDHITRQLRDSHPVQWRDIAHLSDDEAFHQIQSDQIDILVDLAGHSVGNRLPLFARKPAPIQMTWIGYPDTTGVPAIDYRITDAKADPPGMTEHLHTEKLIRLPRCFLCYRPGGDFPPESPLPRLINGFVTFGSFSNYTKVTPETISLWARILTVVPGSRFVTKVRGLSDAMIEQQILALFRKQGIGPERITVLGYSDSVVNHLEEYYRLDIALDTFPYGGTTTTCESLLMGVPVISLAGRAHVSRVGASLLETVGLPELAVDSEEAYLQMAVRLAGDLPRLLQLRKNLRWMVQHSPLCDNLAFTEGLEAVYQQVWAVWCRQQREGIQS